MQIRCYHCHRPFALSKDVVHVALDMIQTENLSHYNAHCPHCRRANRISPDELRRSAPDWQPHETNQEPDQEPD